MKNNFKRHKNFNFETKRPKHVVLKKDCSLKKQISRDSEELGLLKKDQKVLVLDSVFHNDRLRGKVRTSCLLHNEMHTHEGWITLYNYSKNKNFCILDRTVTHQKC